MPIFRTVIAHASRSRSFCRIHHEGHDCNHRRQIVMRRRPVAVYRVIDEAELLGGLVAAESAPAAVAHESDVIPARRERAVVDATRRLLARSYAGERQRYLGLLRLVGAPVLVAVVIFEAAPLWRAQPSSSRPSMGTAVRPAQAGPPHVAATRTAAGRGVVRTSQIVRIAAVQHQTSLPPRPEVAAATPTPAEEFGFER